MRYVHTEEMVDLGGAFTFDGAERLTSNADFELYDAVVIRRTPSDQYEVASVGLLAPGEVTELQFRSTDTLMVPDGLPMQTSRLIRRLADSSRIPPGTSRLVGRLDSSVPGLTITPKASQQTSQTVVLVHLQHGTERSAKPDLNLPGDFRRVNRLKTDGDGQQQSDTTNNDSETAEVAGKG
jgi:hypothetical protein